MNQSKLATFLDLTEDELSEMGLNGEYIFQDKNAEGDSKGSYYFNVPDTTPDSILGKKGWSLGERVAVDASVVN